jgi:hypothetical protein
MQAPALSSNVVSFPLLSGEALDRRLAAVVLSSRHWYVDHLPTDEDLEVYSAGGPCFRIMHDGDEAAMRRRLVEAERALLKRTAIKEWLRARGCKADTADEAILALFDMLQAARPG